MGYRLGSTHGTPLTEGQRDQLDRLLYLEWGVEGEVEGYGASGVAEGRHAKILSPNKKYLFCVLYRFSSQIDR